MILAMMSLLVAILVGVLIYFRSRPRSRFATPRRVEASCEHHQSQKADQPLVKDPDDDIVLSSGSKLVVDSEDGQNHDQNHDQMKQVSLEESSRNVAETLPAVLVLYVMAPQAYAFGGYELLQSLLANGLRYGEKNIFHRHQDKSGSGQKLFSLASVNEPGTFDLAKMGSFECPGLLLFMELDAISDSAQCFEIMLVTAKQLAEDLGGEVWDDQRKSLQTGWIDKFRQSLAKKSEDRNHSTQFAEDPLE